MLVTKIETILTGGAGIGVMELISANTISNIQSVDAVVKVVFDVLIGGVVLYKLLKAKTSTRETALLEWWKRLRGK